MMEDNQDGLRGKRVLICEDEGITQMQLSRLLMLEGMAIIGHATDGQQAVELALRERPDIVLMDISMPVMSGLDAAREILAAYTPCILFLTGYDSVEADRGHAGAHGAILKPFSRDTLAPKLRAAYAAYCRAEGK